MHNWYYIEHAVHNILYNTTVNQAHQDDDYNRYDSESKALRVANCCSRTLSHDVTDFFPNTILILNEKIIIRVFGNSETVINRIGTIRWTMLYEYAQRREIIVPNSYLVPISGSRFLSPQHWAQENE
jgi:hypothetical protein